MTGTLTNRQIVSLEHARKIRGLQSLRPPHLRDIIQTEMSARGWTLRELASRMEGDALRNRALLSHYFLHPTGELWLGGIIADRLARAFGLSTDVLLQLETAWFSASAAPTA